MIPDGDVESSSDSDDDDDDESDDESDEDEDNAENEHDEVDEEAVEGREESQPTEEIEEQANLVDEESKLSQVNTFSFENTPNRFLFRMSFALKRQLLWVYRKTPRVHRRIFKVLPYRERR